MKRVKGSVASLRLTIAGVNGCLCEWLFVWMAAYVNGLRCVTSSPGDIPSSVFHQSYKGEKPVKVTSELSQVSLASADIDLTILHLIRICFNSSWCSSGLAFKYHNWKTRTMVEVCPEEFGESRNVGEEQQVVCVMSESLADHFFSLSRKLLA